MGDCFIVVVFVRNNESNKEKCACACIVSTGELEDIEIDVPDASTHLAKFLVRAVVDEILPPSMILDCMRLGIGGSKGRAVTTTVKVRGDGVVVDRATLSVGIL